MIGSGVKVGSMVGLCCVSEGIVVCAAEIVDMVSVGGVGVAGSDVCGNGLHLTAKISNPEISARKLGFIFSYVQHL